jgi:hypothetical protein
MCTHIHRFYSRFLLANRQSPIFEVAFQQKQKNDKETSSREIFIASPTLLV